MKRVMKLFFSNDLGELRVISFREKEYKESSNITQLKRGHLPHPPQNTKPQKLHGLEQKGHDQNMTKDPWSLNTLGQ